MKWNLQLCNFIVHNIYCTCRYSAAHGPRPLYRYGRAVIDIYIIIGCIILLNIRHKATTELNRRHLPGRERWVMWCDAGNRKWKRLCYINETMTQQSTLSRSVPFCPALPFQNDTALTANRNAFLPSYSHTSTSTPTSTSTSTTITYLIISLDHRECGISTLIGLIYTRRKVCFTVIWSSHELVSWWVGSKAGLNDVCHSLMPNAVSPWFWLTVT